MTTPTTKFKETEIGPIPETWAYVKISDVSEKVGMGPFGSSIKVETFVPQGIPVISGQHLRGSKLEDGEYNFVTLEHAERLQNSNVYRGDVIFTHAGNIGQVAFIPESSKYERYVISQRQFYLRCDKNKILPEFVTYFFQSQIGQHLLLSNRSQTGVPSISQPVSFLRTVQIPVPILSEQRDIVDLLSSLDNKIELNRKINANLEKLASALFKKWFVDIGDALPEGWRISTIGEELDTYLGGTPNREKDEYWMSGTIPWINSGKVNEFRITKPTGYITEAGLNHSAAKLLPRGTVVIAITGATLGQYSLLEIDTSFNQSVVGIKENQNLKKEFVYFWIANTIQNLISSQTGGAQQHINKQVVDNHKILVPDQNILNKYYEISRPIFDIISKHCFEIENLSTIRDSLLPRLMSGKIRVNSL